MNAQIIKNAQTLASELQTKGFEIATWWTDNHLILASVWKGRGWYVQEALDLAWITLNKNTIPNDPCTPFNPSGIRLGTPIMTQRGMKESEMIIVADLIYRVSQTVTQYVYKEEKDERIQQLKDFRAYIQSNNELKIIREEVKTLCNKFPIYK